MATVTVTRTGKRYKLSFSKLPGQSFGPYSSDEAIRDLRVSALLEPVAACKLVVDATIDGSATTETG
jgi:hypothetical protein